MKKTVFFILMFLLFLLFFTPSVWLFFALNRGLEHYDMEYVPQKSRQDLFGATFEGLTLYRDEKPVLEVRKAYFLPLLCFNRLKTTGVTLGSRRSVAIGECTLTHTLLKPLQLQIRCHGKPGTIRGTVDLRKEKAVLMLTPSKALGSGSLRRYFHQTKEGYRYVYDF